jgi:DNA-directed RNA polymerase subunit H (RpoH/RPB5)
VFSQTPIHFAIHWPNGLKQLLRASSLPPEIPVELETPLSASTSYSSYFCKEGDHPVHCSNCSCYESAEIILSYDCSIVDLHACIISASHRTKLKLFEHLKDRRVRLREFCLKKLPEESSKLGLHSNQIPDSKANDVVELLQQKGIEIPRPLRIRIERDSATSTNTYYWRSVYHTIDCPATADMLLQLGFTDLDSNDTQGNTPLSTATSPEYALWLIDHGADITAPSATTVGSKLNQMIAHGVGYEFGLYFFHLYLRMNKGMRKIDIESRNRLLRLICNSDRPDNCRCACSTQGCIPFIFLLKGALNIWSDCSHSAIYLRGIWTGLTELYNVFPQEILEKPGIYLTTLRYITFLALGIRHTCCYSYCMLRMRNFEEFDEEDFEEFREEDSPLVELLEELMEEFETEGEFPDADFIDFLEGYWKDRMEGVLMEMEESKMTNEQKRKLEEIGVKLSKDVEEVPRVMEEEMEEEKDLSYWIRRMDEIVSI